MKVLKIIATILLVTIVAVLAITAYFLIVDIETKIPKKEEENCNIETKEFMSRKIFIMTPKNGEKTDLKILYFHGGSYVAEATTEHFEFLEKIINDTGATVIMPDYPLTPKYNYEDVFNMVVPLYKEIIEEINGENLILMGDSAGGGLSLALIERIGKENIEMPSKTILISPWLDVRLTNFKIDEVQKYDTQLNKETLKLAGLSYAGKDGIDSYLVNPIDGDLRKLQNVIIFTGTYDILNPDVHLLKERANEQGTDIQIKEYEKAKHVWLIENNTDKNLVNMAYNDLINMIIL